MLQFKEDYNQNSDRRGMRDIIVDNRKNLEAAAAEEAVPSFVPLLRAHLMRSTSNRGLLYYGK